MPMPYRLTIRSIDAMRRVAAIVLATTLAACASLPGKRVQQVANRQVEFATSTRAGPAVVFENGLGGRMEWWKKVLPGIAADTTYFAYNRPGYGDSAMTDTPRDGAHVVEELRAVLRDVGIAPPYVLVGHSLGGLYMQLFARRHPDEVAALVLVDSTHPKQLEGAGAIEKQSFITRAAIGVLVTGVANEELRLLPDTGADVLSLPTLTGKPVYVLSASEPMKETSEAARAANEKRIDIARLYPGSRQIWVDSGHAVPLDKPDAVVSVIRTAISEIRQKGQ